MMLSIPANRSLSLSSHVWLNILARLGCGFVDRVKHLSAWLYLDTHVVMNSLDHLNVNVVYMMTND